MALEVPSTTSVEVARMAVALAIASSGNFGVAAKTVDDYVDKVTAAYIKVYNQILANEREQGLR